MTNIDRGSEGGYMVACSDEGSYVMASRRRFADRGEAVEYAAGICDSRWPVVLPVRWYTPVNLPKFGEAVNVAVDLPDGTMRITTVTKGGDCYPPLPDLMEMKWWLKRHIPNR